VNEDKYLYECGWRCAGENLSGKLVWEKECDEYVFMSEYEVGTENAVAKQVELDRQRSEFAAAWRRQASKVAEGKIR
jgi:hypothetical protein